MGDNQVKTWDNGATARAVPKTDARGDNQVEASNEEADVIVEEGEEFKAPGDGATARALAEGGAVIDNWIEVHAKEVDVIVEEVEESKVPNKETVKGTDAVWDLKNTSPKVIDEDPEVTQVPVAVSMPNHGDTLDFKGMPDLEVPWKSQEKNLQWTPSQLRGPQPCLGSASRLRSNTGW